MKQHVFGLPLGRILDVRWAYKKVTKHYTNFIPTGKSDAAVAFSRNGIPLEIHGRQTEGCGLVCPDHRITHRVGSLCVQE